MNWYRDDMKLKSFSHRSTCHESREKWYGITYYTTTISQFSNFDSKEFFPIVLKVHEWIQFSENSDGLTILSKKKKAARVWFQCYNFVGKNVLAGVFAAILKRRWTYFRDICTINIKSLIERQCPKRLNSMHFKSTGFNINKDGPKRMKSLMIDDKCSLKNERFWQYWKICQYTIDGWKETDFIDENGWLSHTLLFHTCKLRRRKIHLITFTQFFIE